MKIIRENVWMLDSICFQTFHICFQTFLHQEANIYLDMLRKCLLKMYIWTIIVARDPCLWFALKKKTPFFENFCTRMLTPIVKVVPLCLPPPCPAAHAYYIISSFFFNGVFWAPKHPNTWAWGVLGDKTPHRKWGVLGNFADGVFWKWGVFGCILL